MGRQGTFAEYAAVDECWLYPTPEEVSDQDAAAAALVGITAHLGLFREAQLKAGEKRVRQRRLGRSRIVRGADGPRHRRPRAGDRRHEGEGANLPSARGQPRRSNYKSDDLDAAIAKFGAIDVWFETRREPDFDQAVKYLALGGRMIVMAGREARPKFPVGPFYTKDCKLLGFAMFNAPAEEQRKSAAEINRWLAKGKLKPRIDRVMKLSEAAAAHKLQEESTFRKAGTLAGKIVLVP